MIQEHGFHFSKFANTENLDEEVVSEPISLSNSSLIIMISTFIFSICFGIGPGPIPWLAPTVIMEPENVAMGNSISNFTNWFGSFIVAFLFPYWRRNVYDSLAFTPFLATLLLLTIPTYWLYPSNKTKDTDESEKERQDIVFEIKLERERLKDSKTDEPCNPSTDPYSFLDENENTKCAFNRENSVNHRMINRFKVEKVEELKDTAEGKSSIADKDPKETQGENNTKERKPELVLDTKIKIEDAKLDRYDSTLKLELVVQI